jgi:hypothetical protein
MHKFEVYMHWSVKRALRGCIVECILSIVVKLLHSSLQFKKYFYSLGMKEKADY